MNLRTSFLVARFPEAPRITMTVLALSLWLTEVRLPVSTYQNHFPCGDDLEVSEKEHSLCKDEWHQPLTLDLLP